MPERKTTSTCSQKRDCTARELLLGMIPLYSMQHPLLSARLFLEQVEQKFSHKLFINVKQWEMLLILQCSINLKVKA